MLAEQAAHPMETARKGASTHRSADHDWAEEVESFVHTYLIISESLHNLGDVEQNGIL